MWVKNDCSGVQPATDSIASTAASRHVTVRATVLVVLLTYRPETSYRVPRTVVVGCYV